jgi:uncharacterized protein YdcH (DUF465 family)
MPTVVELRAECKRKGIKGYSKMRKVELLKLCRSAKGKKIYIKYWGKYITLTRAELAIYNFAKKTVFDFEENWLIDESSGKLYFKEHHAWKGIFDPSPKLNKMIDNLKKRKKLKKKKINKAKGKKIYIKYWEKYTTLTRAELAIYNFAKKTVFDFEDNWLIDESSDGKLYFKKHYAWKRIFEPSQKLNKMIENLKRSRKKK